MEKTGEVFPLAQSSVVPGWASKSDGFNKLREYYLKYNISIDELVKDSSSFLPFRFVRLNPIFDEQDTLRQLKKELPDDKQNDFPVQVSWMNPEFSFYALPGDFQLAQSNCFQEARVYGQDVSSGAAVAALLSNYHDREKGMTTPGVEKIERVLDMCCAPGLKLSAIADRIRQLQPNESTLLVGVDNSKSRLATTRNILQKYQIEPRSELSITDVIQIQLCCNDGTAFRPDRNRNLVYDSYLAMNERVHSGKRKRRNKGSRERERKKLQELLQQCSSCNDEDIQLFDRVLVDAECSTDGSLKHIKKWVENANIDIARRLTDPVELAQLVEIQESLASTGFTLLKPGGTMVYSTCSLSVEQNEQVVEWLLRKYSPQATLVPLRFEGDDNLIRSGTINGTIRFLPATKMSKNASIGEANGGSVYGGGFFLAKIKKAVS